MKLALIPQGTGIRVLSVLATMELALVGCAHPKKADDAGRDLVITDRNQSVQQKQLETAQESSTYKMGLSERFLMPQLRQGRTPELSADSSRTSLAPTTVCVRLVLNEQGTVDAVLPLDDRAECQAGMAPDNQDLMTAVQAGVLRWTFSPAAICTWKEGVSAPLLGGCNGAESVRPVPVSLMYAFTFEIREGKRIVRQVR
jgi:hypothetical protein